MEPKKKTDYEPLRDLFTSITPSVELFQAFYSDRNRFYSERFSKFDETFLFVQLDGSADDLNQEMFDDRGEIENALETALTKHKVGRVIGGGTGLKYSYIYLALVNVPSGVKCIRETLQAGKITQRSWILFHDADRQQEWIGIWDDTPAPKLPDIEAT